MKATAVREISREQYTRMVEEITEFLGQEEKRNPDNFQPGQWADGDYWANWGISQ